MNTRWKDTEIGRNLSKSLTVKSVGDLGAVDFQPSAEIVFVLLTEGDIAHGSNGCDEKIKEAEKFKLANRGMKVHYIFHKTNQTVQFFHKLQEKIVIENGDGLIPLINLECVSQLIHQFQIAQNRSNPFVSVANGSTANIQKDILLSVCNVPGLGEKRARKLLAKFDTLKRLSKATQLDLKPVIGENCARGVHDFFIKRNTL